MPRHGTTLMIALRGSIVKFTHGSLEALQVTHGLPGYRRGSGSVRRGVLRVLSLRVTDPRLTRNRQVIMTRAACIQVIAVDPKCTAGASSDFGRRHFSDSEKSLFSNRERYSADDLNADVGLPDARKGSRQATQQMEGVRGHQNMAIMPSPC